MLAGVFGLLVLATLIVQLMRRAKPQQDYTELVQRVNTWWIIIAVFTLAIALNRNLSIIFFAFLSFLALKEFLSLIPTRRADRRVLFWAYAAIPIQYYWVHTGWFNMFIIFVPVWVLFAISARMVMIGETRDFLRAVGTLQWGVMTMVFGISHLAYLLVLPLSKNDAYTGAGLVVYLVFLTQFNDVAQYVWGKSFGKHKVTPTVSPNKTVEGLLGGVLTTTALAWLLAPLLTPLSPRDALIAGAIIGLGGFLGDITISAVKRDIGVKDTGTILPGHGGILDRIDSLIATAPLFFHFVNRFYY
jgi:phosphatidate cytidylyltransferase